MRAQLPPRLLGLTAALMVCGLALASGAPAAAQSNEYDPYRGIYCPAAGCSPEDIAWARAQQAARQADLRRRYGEQQALTIPATKADLTLGCDGVTVQIWFDAGLLTWGVGADRKVWRLDKVLPAEITFKRVSEYPNEGGFFDAVGTIDRVSGGFSRGDSIYPSTPSDYGHCEPTAARF
jgi:hypothetical protein